MSSQEFSFKQEEKKEEKIHFATFFPALPFLVSVPTIKFGRTSFALDF